jgi:MFS family permease
MTVEGAATPRARALGLATEAACYATGFFSLGLIPTMWLVVPLWALMLGASPLQIGLVVGARSLLPVMFSIHGGVVMDRLGVRRVMFWLAGASIAMVPAYPLLPWVPALWLSIHFLPATDDDADRPAEPFRPGMLVPRLSDYLDAARLLAVPAVALVVTATFARIAAVSVQGSFYPVYLESIDFSGTVIGGLIATSSIVASLSALASGVLSRIVRQSWILIAAIALSVAAITATPFFTMLPALSLLAVSFGIGIGLTLPPVLSILSQAAGPSRQGMSVGLRSTANRVASLVVPVGMGIVADVFDVQGAFLAAGAMLVAALAAMAALVVRHRL